MPGTICLTFVRIRPVNFIMTATNNIAKMHAMLLYPLVRRGCSQHNVRTTDFGMRERMDGCWIGWIASRNSDVWQVLEEWSIEDQVVQLN